MTEKYQKLSGLITEIEDRKQTLQAREKELAGLIAAKQAEFDTIELAGQPTKAIKKEIHDLELEAADTTRALRSYSGVSNTAVHKKNKGLVRLAAEVVSDNQDSITALQGEFDSKAAELAEIKAAFLSKVAAMGKITREAAQLAREMSQANKYASDKNIHFAGVVDGVHELRDEGTIYIPVDECKKAYKEGVAR